MAKKINKSNINDCYGDYSLLAQTVRYNKPKCFALLIKMGADVNKICNDYVPPLMHAVKYGRLEMVKVLIANGANVNYQYDGERAAIQGMTPLTYAEKYDQKEIVEYLKSLKK